MDEADVIKQAMSALGKRVSKRKAATSRKNGRKGGRPKKAKTDAK